MPVPMSATQIADDLENQIHKGKYATGSRLPSYRELAVEYGVGITTISLVIAILKDRGVVQGFQGRGVYVAEE